MNDSIFTKMMLSLQESRAEETKKNLTALKESKEAKNLNEETEIEVAEKDIEAPLSEVEVVETEETPVEECKEEDEKEGKVKTEDISQDSQIKTTNKGQNEEELDGIKPATGKDGVPEESTKKDKLDSMNPDADPKTDVDLDKEVKATKLESEGSEADIAIRTGGRLIEITDEENCEECAETCPECGEENCVCEPTEEVEVTEEPVEELEVIDEPVEEVEEEEEFIDESTFNPFLTKFIKDNYSNAKAVVVEGVKMNKKELTLECKTIFNSGKTSKFNLGLRGIVREGKVCKLRAYDNGYFKAESVKAPLTFKVSYKNNTLKCEGLEYNFNTKLTEGKIKNIKGKLIIK